MVSRSAPVSRSQPAICIGHDIAVLDRIYASIGIRPKSQTPQTTTRGILDDAYLSAIPPGVATLRDAIEKGRDTYRVTHSRT